MLFLLPFSKKEKNYRGDINVYVSKKMRGGITLGKYIFLDSYYGDINRCKDTWDHEWGHTRQSRMLGPLYLIVIGLPSICWAAIYDTKLVPYTYNGYYKFYTERGADKLGGVIRE